MMSRLSLRGLARESRRHSRRRSLCAAGRQDSEALRQRAFAVRHLPRFHRALDIRLSNGDLTPRGPGGRPHLRRPHWGRRPNCSSRRPTHSVRAGSHVAHGAPAWDASIRRRRRFHSGHVPAGRHSHHAEGRVRSCACGVRHASRWRRSVLERRALVAPQQFDHASDLGPLPGRRRQQAPIWRLKPPSCGPSRRSPPSRQPRCRRVRRAHDFRRFLAGRGADTFLGLRVVFLGRNGFSPAAVRFNANARPWASSSRRQTGMFGLAF